MSEIPFNIQTEAGKKLWEQMNREQGSSVWGAVGEGIEAIEAEVVERILSILQKQMDDCCGYGPAECFTHSTISTSVALIKGENK